MESTKFTKSLFWLGVVTAVFFLYNLIAIYAFRDAVFVQKGSIDGFWEGLIIPGFLLIVVFSLASFTWLIRKMKEEGNSTGWGLLLVLGFVCCVLLLGEKTMVDEIARESSAGLDARGEWIMLYVGLGLQLVFVGLMLRVLRPGFLEGGEYVA